MNKPSRTKILIVEDDESYQDFYREFFKLHHKNEFVWQLASSGEAALEYLVRNQVDLVVLDWTLPGISGLETLHHIRKNDRFVLIILATAHAKPDEVCEALETGADDYLTKPFEEEVLLARLHSLKRRRETFLPQTGVHEFDGLRAELGSGFILIDNHRVELSGKERDLLSIFLRRPNMIHSPTYLMEMAWGYALKDHNILERHLSSLRKKMGAKWGSRLKSKYGAGYFLDLESSISASSH